MRIGFLVFPRLTQLDLTGPFEVLARLPGAVPRLVWKTTEPVAADTGLMLVPHESFAGCAQLDMLVVPGGPGTGDAAEDPEVVDFVRRQAAAARYVTSVCTGALILGAAGVLKGRRATTHWAAHHWLARLGAAPVKARVVRDGNLFTGGGVTAGIDFALTIAAEVAGPEVAQAIQLQIEYAPDPPFAAGSPDTAPAPVLEAARVRGAAMRAQREAMVERIAARLQDEQAGIGPEIRGAGRTAP